MKGADGTRSSLLPRSHFVLLCAFVVSYFLFFHHLADRDLWSSHEGRAAMDADSVLNGDWGLPRLHDNRPELQKPPLYYWLVALTARVRGGAVDAWAVRFPAALSALGCVLLLVWFGRRVGRPGAGLTSALILATAIHFPWLARIGRIDMPLTFAVSVACVAFYLSGRATCGVRRAACGVRRAMCNRLFLQIVGYVAVATSILLKGPIGAVLPAVVMLAHRLFSPRTPHAARRTPHGLWWGVPLVLALTLPWFLWANAVTDGDFFRVFIWYHNVERGLGGATLRAHAWWLYLPYFANDFLPWTPLLIAAGIIAWRRDWLRTDSVTRFGLLWLTAVVGILSCARFKRADYLLPAYPGAALFLGCVLARLAETWNAAPRRRLVLQVSVGSLALASMVGWVWRVERGLPAEEPFRDYSDFAAAVREAAPSPEEVVFFQTEAHALAFHVGRPLAVVVEWKILQDRLESKAATTHIVMPQDRAAVVQEHLLGIRLSEVLRNTDLSGGRHERPLVLVRAELESMPCPSSRSCRRSQTSP